MPSHEGARRGGAKHRKNSPQVTVFSQSGEVAVLRAGGSCEWEHSDPSNGRIVKPSCNSYSFVTIPHPPAVGAPFRAMWALICPLARIKKQ